LREYEREEVVANWSSLWDSEEKNLCQLRF
jgi:hypothetical protein